MRQLYFFAIIILIALSFNPLYAKNTCDQQINIAILDFDAKDIPVQEAKKITELIRVEIIKTNCFVVIERSKMNEILKEQGFQQTGCVEESCAVQAGKLLSARKILLGSIMKFDQDVLIAARIIDVENGSADASEKEYYKKGSIVDMTDAIERLASKFVGMKITKRDDAEKEKKKIQPDDKLKSDKRVMRNGYVNPYGWVSIGFLALSLGGVGATCYYNDEFVRNSKVYNRSRIPLKLGLYQLLATSQTIPALFLNIGIKNGKKFMDDLEFKRNSYAIASGVAGGIALAFAITAIYYHVIQGTSMSTQGMMPGNIIASPIIRFDKSLSGKPGAHFSAGLALQSIF